LNNKVALIIQARATSERLPRKIFADLAGKTVLEHVLIAMKSCKLPDEIYVATTINEEDDQIAHIAEKYNIICVRGDEMDVLSRFEMVSKISDANVFVRITADDPLLDPNVTDIVIADYLKGGCDYVSNIVERSWPRGLDTEVFSRTALETTLKDADLKDYREHVTLYIRANPDKFSIRNVSSPPEEYMPSLRLCIDTNEDYELLKVIFGHLYKEGEIIRIGEVIKFLEDNPKYLEINNTIEQKKTLGKVY